MGSTDLKPSRHGRPARVGSLRADTIKLIIFSVAALFLMGFVVLSLGKKDTSVSDMRITKPEIAEIKKAGLPFEKPEAEVTTGTDGFPYGRDVLGKIKHQNPSLEWEPYFYLAHLVMQHSQDELREMADTKVQWADVCDDPLKHTGQVVRVTGSLARLREAPVPPNPCDLKAVYQGQVVDKDFRFWTFILTEKPPEDIREDDLVRIYGPFFKIWEYETNIPNTWKLTAVVVARNFVRVEADKTPVLGIAIIVLTAVIVVVMFVAVRWDKVRDAEARAKRQEKMKGKRPAEINELARALSERAAEEKAAIFGLKSDSGRPTHEGKGEAEGGTGKGGRDEEEGGGTGKESSLASCQGSDQPSPDLVNGGDAGADSRQANEDSNLDAGEEERQSDGDTGKGTTA